MDSTSPEDRPVLVFDFGSQYVQLIARRVRERHAFARIVRHDVSADQARALNPLALVLSGGPSSVYEPGAPRCDPVIRPPTSCSRLRTATGSWHWQTIAASRLCCWP